MGWRRRTKTTRRLIVTNGAKLWREEGTQLKHSCKLGGGVLTSGKCHRRTQGAIEAKAVDTTQPWCLLRESRCWEFDK